MYVCKYFLSFSTFFKKGIYFFVSMCYYIDMSKSGSNKGIYIFWGGIALVVAIVLLIIFLPRTNTAMPYGNMYSLSYNIKQTDKNGKDINYYTEALINDASADGVAKTNLNNLYALQKAMTNSDGFCLTGLLYLTPGENYRGLVSSQNTIARSLGTSLYEFHKYCTEFVTPLFDDQEHFVDRGLVVNETLLVYYSKYSALLKEIAEFYYTTAQLMHSSATQCMEVSPILLDKHLEHITKVYNHATSGIVSAAEASQLLNSSTVIYADGYYKDFI